MLLAGAIGCAQSDVPSDPIAVSQQAISREIRLRYPAGTFGDVPLVAIDDRRLSLAEP